MKWKKAGKIFDPTAHALTHNCREFAQSPQALVFQDFVRVYFSTRAVDDTGKFLSHISFVDFDKNFKVLQVSRNTVIPLGKLGCFDEHGIFPMNVLKRDNKVLAFTSGLSRRVSVSIDSSIGFATSEDDGLTFKKYGDGPILTTSLHEPFLVCDPFVSFLNGTFHMWYVYGTKWIRDAEADKSPSRVYKIGHAVSTDATSWKKEGRQIVADKLNANECQALPSVIEIEKRYHMFFCFRQAVDFRKSKDGSYRIGYAFSDDLVNWTRDDQNCGIDVTPGAWDSEMMCYPNVFKWGENYHMLYNGNEFGRLGFGLATLEH